MPFPQDVKQEQAEQTGRDPYSCASREGFKQMNEKHTKKSSVQFPKS